MNSLISNTWLRAAGLALALTLTSAGCGDVVEPGDTEPPAQTEPSQNQVTSATGVAKGARFTMQIQVGHAYSQKPTTGAHKLKTASPLTGGNQ